MRQIDMLEVLCSKLEANGYTNTDIEQFLQNPIFRDLIQTNFGIQQLMVQSIDETYEVVEITWPLLG